MMIDGTADAISQGRRAGPSRFSFWRPQYLLGAALILLLAGGVYGVMSTVLSPPPPKMKQVVQQISLLPPPPPPSVEQQPPPQPEAKEAMSMADPAPAPQDAAPPGDLGLDADASGGSDGFQLQARKGGRSLLDSGDPFGWYSNRIQESIYKVLSANKAFRDANFDVHLKLWLNHDGSIQRVELVDSSGSALVDRSLKLAVTEVGSIGHDLPADLPQPVRIKISHHQ